MTFIKCRISLLFLCCLLCISSLDRVLAQEHAQVSTVKLKDALNKVSKTFAVNFIYESSLLNEKTSLLDSKMLQQKKLEFVLSALLEPLAIGYYRVDHNNYALFKLRDAQQKEGKVLLTIASTAVEDQKSTIKGFVGNRSNQALAYSTVSLLGKDSLRIAQAIADSLGWYKFNQIGAGSYRIQVTRIGYQTTCSPLFHLLPRQELLLDELILAEVPKRLAPIVVSADRPLFEYKADRTIVNLEGVFSGAGASISDLLAILPGVTMDNEQISLKGKQGVNIMIDGRPIKLPGSQLFSLLKSLPSMAVSQIELIHSPSAKYDAQGRAGVINLKMANSETMGLNGIINSVFSIGTRPKFTESVLLNYGTRKINLSASYSYQDLQNANEFLRENLIDAAKPIFYRQDESESSRSISHNALLGVAYQLNPKNTIAAHGTLDMDDHRSTFNRQLSLVAPQSSLPDSSISSLNKGLQHLRTYGLNLNSKHQLGTITQLLLFNANYTRYRSNSPATFQNLYVGPPAQSLNRAENIANNTEVALKLFSAGADYSHPIGQHHQLDIGAKLAFTHSNSKVLFQYGNSNSTLLNDLARSNSFEYKEKISAAYLNYQGDFGSGTSLQAGIRVENTNYKSASIAGDQQTSQNYLQFFPNLMLRHEYGKHLWTLNYNRRVGRPSYQDLNPFITYFSPFFYTLGNQFLSAETTHHLAVDYNYGAALHFSLGYSSTNNYLGSIVSLDEGSLTLRQRIVNFGHYRSLNFTSAYQKTVLNYWNLNISASLFYDDFEGSYLNATLKNKLLGFNFNILNSFKLSPKLSLEVLNLYQSRRAQLAGSNLGRYRADATLKYRILNKRGSLSLGMNDIFYTYLNQGTNQFLKLHSNYVYRNENRRFQLGLSYSFGSKTIQNNKIQHNQEELDRIKPQK